MIGIVACLVLVTLYLVAVLYGLQMTTVGRHALRPTHNVRQAVRVVWEAFMQPAAMSWWQLRRYFSAQWASAEPRWQEVAW